MSLPANTPIAANASTVTTNRMPGTSSLNVGVAVRSSTTIASTRRISYRRTVSGPTALPTANAGGSVAQLKKIAASMVRVGRTSHTNPIPASPITMTATFVEVATAAPASTQTAIAAVNATTAASGSSRRVTTATGRTVNPGALAACFEPEPIGPEASVGARRRAPRRRGRSLPRKLAKTFRPDHCAPTGPEAAVADSRLGDRR